MTTATAEGNAVPRFGSAIVLAQLFRDVWPEYNQHGNHTAAYFGVLFPRSADFRILILDDHSSRVWHGGERSRSAGTVSLDDLPHGIDALGLQAVQERGAVTALSALAAEFDKSAQKSPLTSRVIAAMVTIAKMHALGTSVARCGGAIRIAIR